MAKCLVTDLQDTVNSDSLVKVGELRLKVKKVSDPQNYNNGLHIVTSKDSTIEIIGDGYFTNKAQTENKGKIASLPNSVWNTFYFSNGDYEISLKDKYSLTEINTRHSSDYGRRTGNISMNMNEVSFCKKLENLYYTQLFDIDNIKDLLSLNSISVSCYGDISSLKNLTKLRTVYISGDLTGDVEAFANCSVLDQLNVTGKFYGDLSKLPSSCRLFNIGASDQGSSFTWTSRESSANIVSIPYGPVISDIDKMLTDQAACKVPSNFSSLASYEKAITATGTRTSASDDAISTLQGKGYTVAITSA